MYPTHRVGFRARSSLGFKADRQGVEASPVGSGYACAMVGLAQVSEGSGFSIPLRFEAWQIAHSNVKDLAPTNIDIGFKPLRLR
ncbi:hypothetical protein HAX54_043447 [Datura stramonium]|uniref:Uncharacterized protein n=1 Tax=Datura stramonium TaxID=4076 RepID=A0ABS8RP50_DATST|nr:hypothetical protein [Datura stramonium]